jgi:plasmid stabilization system protein ParE
VNYRVKISLNALTNAEAILRWFHEQQADVAGARWYAALLSKIDTLETQPQRCVLAEESAELGIELRQLLFGRRRGVYRILFTIEGTTVQILHIRHAARDALSLEDLYQSD